MRVAGSRMIKRKAGVVVVLTSAYLTHKWNEYQFPKREYYRLYHTHTETVLLENRNRPEPSVSPRDTLQTTTDTNNTCTMNSFIEFFYPQQAKLEPQKLESVTSPSYNPNSAENIKDLMIEKVGKEKIQEVIDSPKMHSCYSVTEHLATGDASEIFDFYAVRFISLAVSVAASFFAIFGYNRWISGELPPFRNIHYARAFARSTKWGCGLTFLLATPVLWGIRNAEYIDQQRKLRKISPNSPSIHSSSFRRELSFYPYALAVTCASFTGYVVGFVVGTFLLLG